MNARLARVLGLRASGAAGRHADRRTKRARTRGASNRRAIKEQRHDDRG